MKIYLINMERSKDRLDLFMKNASPFGVEIKRIKAVDGRTIDEATYGRFAATALPGDRMLTPAELGCLLSHKKAWEAFLTGEEKWAFIAEDDIAFSLDAGSFLTSEHWIPSSVHIVKAETNLAPQTIWRKPVSSVKNHRIHEILSDHDKAGGYFISRIAAQTLISLTDKHFVPVDLIIFNRGKNAYHNLSILQILPAICIQYGLLDRGLVSERLPSTIDEDMPRFPREEKPDLSQREKIAREVRRLRRQARYRLSQLKNYMFEDAIIRTIPFGPK